MGRSDSINGGHVVVPIEWDPNSLFYTLSPTKNVNEVRYVNVRYPLRMGPVTNNDEDAKGDEEKLDKYLDDFFLPWYRAPSPEEQEEY